MATENPGAGKKRGADNEETSNAESEGGKYVPAEPTVVTPSKRNDDGSKAMNIDGDNSGQATAAAAAATNSRATAAAEQVRGTETAAAAEQARGTATAEGAGEAPTDKSESQENMDVDSVGEPPVGTMYSKLFKNAQKKKGVLKMGKYGTTGGTSKPASYASKAATTRKTRKPKSFKHRAWIQVVVNVNKAQYPAAAFREKIRELFDWLDDTAGAGDWGLIPVNQTTLQSATPPLMHRSDVPDTHRETLKFVHCFNNEKDFQKPIKNDNGRDFEFSCQLGCEKDIETLLSGGTAVDLYEKGVSVELRRFPSKSSKKDIVIWWAHRDLAQEFVEEAVTDSFLKARKKVAEEDTHLSTIGRSMVNEPAPFVLLAHCLYPPHNYDNRPRDAQGNRPRTKYAAKDKQVWTVEYDEEEEDEVKSLLDVATTFIRDKLGYRARFGTTKDPELDKGTAFQTYKTNCDTHLASMSGIAQVVLGTANDIYKSFQCKEEADEGKPARVREISISGLLKEVTYTTTTGKQAPVFYCLAGNKSNDWVGMTVEVPDAIHKASNIGKCLAGWVMYQLVELNIKETHIQRFLAESFSTHQVKIALELTVYDSESGELTVIDSTTVEGDEAMEIQQLQAEDWVDMSILTDGPPIVHGNAAAGFVFDPNDAASLGSGQSQAPSMGDCSFAQLQKSAARGLSGALNRRRNAKMNMEVDDDETTAPEQTGTRSAAESNQDDGTTAAAPSGADSNGAPPAHVGGSTSGAPMVNETAMGPEAK